MKEDQYSEQLLALTEIRSLMEKSTKFVSLSGKTGVSIGFIAIIAAAVCYFVTATTPFSNRYFHEVIFSKELIFGMTPYVFVFVLALVTILFSLIIGSHYTLQKAKNSGLKLWDSSFKLMVVNIAIPLVTGGIFCLALMKYEAYVMIAPATLIFYGLALINGAKYTLQDVNSLGILEISLGLLGLFIPGFGLELWAIGFGVFHIVYGIRMNKKYK